MSQHLVYVSRNNQPCEILIGWDKPLQLFFLDVKVLTPRKTCVEDPFNYVYLYSSLEDPNSNSPFNNPGMDAAQALEYYTDRLKQLDITLPDYILNQLLEDKKNNAGNSTMIHEQSSDGQWKTTCESDDP